MFPELVFSRSAHPDIPYMRPKTPECIGRAFVIGESWRSQSISFFFAWRDPPLMSVWTVHISGGKIEISFCKQILERLVLLLSSFYQNAVTHLLASPRAFYSLSSRDFSGKAQGGIFLAFASRQFEHLSWLAGAAFWAAFFPTGRQKVFLPIQRTSVYHFFIWPSICLSIHFQSFFSIVPNCLFSPQKKRNAIPRLSCRSLSLFLLTVPQLLREVCVPTCLFWVTDHSV